MTLHYAALKFYFFTENSLSNIEKNTVKIIRTKPDPLNTGVFF